ncbi:MAG: hypothetical protein ACUVTO_05130 [Candidatus Caldatribacteriaceae bacterium]
MQKRVLFISNGYGEDSFAALILSEFLKEITKEEIPCFVDALPLVGEGKVFAELVCSFPQRIRLLHSSPHLPFGGVYLGEPLRRFLRFLRDLLGGGLQNTCSVIRLLLRFSSSFDMVVGVGDVFPLLLGLLFARKKVYLFACAHTTLLRQKGKPYERLGRVTAHLFRRCAEKVYTRDAPTALWFQSLGIKAEFLGFVGPEIPHFKNKEIILFLPGHRRDWRENFRFLYEVLTLSKDDLVSFPLHFVFPPERTTFEIVEVIQEVGGIPLSCSSFQIENLSVSFSQGDYLTHLGRAKLVVGFAGTALEQAACLGIPCLEPYRKDAIQANRHFLQTRQTLLLREALIQGGGTPEETATILKNVLANLPRFQKEAQNFAQRTWEGKMDGAKNIAFDLINTLRTPLRLQGRAPVGGDFRTGTR